jgi:ubiquinone/menaquinone biosynthesis C-methylase UbiE
MTDGSARTVAFTDQSLPARYEQRLAPSLFEPWAEVLLDAVAPPPGAAVLDVASGTGVVARAAARRVGTSGRVLATDISPAMIDFNASHPPEPGSAPIETAVASATDLGCADGEFDVVLCQQGMPFFPDRPGAMREMHRVLRSDGLVGVAVWTPGREVVPFGPMNCVMQEIGVPPPFPGAYDQGSYVLTAEQVAELLREAGFNDVDSREVELVTRWAGVQALVDSISGTPFGATLDGLDPDRQKQARRMIADRFAPWAIDDGRVEVPTYSVIARAVASSTRRSRATRPAASPNG